jgi:hypothetical protein
MNRLRVLCRHLSSSEAEGAASAAPVGGGLDDGATEILWDNFGVPHIIAPDHPRLFHAYGYAQMEAHSELLISLYAQAQGRGAEFYHSPSGTSPGSEALLKADRWVRTNDIPATARRWTMTQSEEFGPLIDSFATGVSLWASKHEDQLSAAAAAVIAGLGGSITAEHVYAHCLRVIHYDWIVSPTRWAHPQNLFIIQLSHLPSPSAWLVDSNQFTRAVRSGVTLCRHSS